MFRMNAPNCNILALGLLLAASPVHAQQRDPSIAPQCTRSSASFCRQTLHDKFLSYAVGTFGPRALFVPLFPASYLMTFPPDRYPHDWREGLPALGRNYADQLAAQTSFQTARFATSAILHEDLRYRRSTSKHPLERVGHALAYSFVDKSDSGHAQIAWSNFAGAAASGYVGRLYLPAGFNDVSHADTSMAIRFGAVAGRNVAEEFSPELVRLAKKLHLKIIHLLPEWWTSLDR
jgi:hypothetical protein